jgi:signal transduction histidine kinase
MLGTEGVELEISDDGRGFDPAVATSGHHGLRIMRERAGAIDAELSIESGPGQGTRINICWPSTAVVRVE